MLQEYNNYVIFWRDLYFGEKSLNWIELNLFRIFKQLSLLRWKGEGMKLAWTYPSPYRYWAISITYKFSNSIQCRNIVSRQCWSILLQNSQTVNFIFFGTVLSRYHYGTRFVWRYHPAFAWLWPKGKPCRNCRHGRRSRNCYQDITIAKPKNAPANKLRYLGKAEMNRDNHK